MWSTRGVRAWHEGWWEVGRETGNMLAPILGVPTNTISMHQNVTVAQGIIASCFTYHGPRRKIVMSELEFPSNHYLFEGFRRYGAEIVYVPSADPIRARPAAVPRRDRRADRPRPAVAGAVQERVHHRRRAVVEKAHRVGAHVIVDVYQGAGTVPMDLGSLAGRLRRRRIGEVAVRRTRAPDISTCGRTWRRRSSRAVGWAAHEAPFDFAGGARPLRRRARAFPERHAERAVALFGARGLRDRRRDRRAGDPRAVAAAHPPDHRRAPRRPATG